MDDFHFGLIQGECLVTTCSLDAFCFPPFSPIFFPFEVYRAHQLWARMNQQPPAHNEGGIGWQVDRKHFSIEFQFPR
jgi:hypothetical protein